MGSAMEDRSGPADHSSTMPPQSRILHLRSTFQPLAPAQWFVLTEASVPHPSTVLHSRQMCPPDGAQQQLEHSRQIARRSPTGLKLVCSQLATSVVLMPSPEHLDSRSFALPHLQCRSVSVQEVTTNRYRHPSGWRRFGLAKFDLVKLELKLARFR